MTHVSMELFGIFWRTYLLLIYLIQSAEANGQKLGNNILLFKEFKIISAKKSVIGKIDYFLRREREIWVELILNQNVSTFDLNVKLDIIKKDNRCMNIFSHRFDGCKFLQEGYSNIRAISVITAKLFKTTNVPRKCPMLANELYYIRNYTADLKDFYNLYLVIPQLRWRLSIEFYLGQTFQAKAILEGEITAP